MLIPGSTTKGRLLAGIIAAALLIPAISLARPAPLPLEQKIHNFETILSKASRSKFDESELAKIKKLIEESETRLKAGDASTAEKLYSQAWEAYQAASRATQAQNHQARDERVLAVKTSSAKALLKQLETIDGSGETSKAAQIEGIKSLLAQAETTNDPVKALAIANQAFFTLKIMLKDARSGKKLTVDHTHTTKEMQYADEHAYNEAHFGLLDTALEQLHAKADAKYNQSVDQARKLRELAEEKAEQKDYDSAIRDIMLSTKEIMKALKHIGLPVPGLSLQE